MSRYTALLERGLGEVAENVYAGLLSSIVEVERMGDIEDLMVRATGIHPVRMGSKGNCPNCGAGYHGRECGYCGTWR